MGYKIAVCKWENLNRLDAKYMLCRKSLNISYLFWWELSLGSVSAQKAYHRRISFRSHLVQDE